MARPGMLQISMYVRMVNFVLPPLSSSVYLCSPVLSIEYVLLLQRSWGVEGALESQKIGGQITLINHGILSLTIIVANPKSNGDRVLFQRFCKQADETDRFR